MPAAPLGFLYGCAWFAAFMVAHISILHFKISTGPSRCLIVCFAAAVTASAICIALTCAPIWQSLLLAEIYGLVTIGCLFILYAPFFYTIYTSLSIQSLLAIKAAGGSLQLGDLVSRFASADLFHGRLATMTKSGYLIEEQGRYGLTAKGIWVARCFSAIKSILKLGPGG